MTDETLSTSASLKKNTEKFWGGILATLLTITLSHLIGLEAEDILGALILGYTGAKLFINKVLPAIVRTFKPDLAASKKVETNKQKGTNVESMEYNASNIKTIGSKSSRILTSCAITYFISHFITPILSKIALGSPYLTSIMGLIALFMPAVQIVALSVFAITAVYVVRDKVRSYQRQRSAQASQEPKELINNDFRISQNELNIVTQKESLCGIFSLVVMNSALVAFQVAQFIIGAKVVTPIAAIVLTGFIGAYTLFYTLPKGTYNIAIAFRKANVEKLKVSRSSEESNQNDKKQKINITPSSVNKAMALAITGMIAHHGVTMIFSLPFIQHLAVITTGFITASAVVLVAIPRMINKRRLNSFKQSELFQQVSSNYETKSDYEEITLSRADLECAVAELYQSRPDIVVSALICSDKSGGASSEIEKAITKHGFMGVEIFIDRLSDHVLKSTYAQKDLAKTTVLQGPYFHKSAASLELSTTAPKRATVARETVNTKESLSDDNIMRPH